MDLLKQCQQWFEQNELQKVIDALEAIPAGERTPELDSELAKAYLAIAEIGEREPYEKMCIRDRTGPTPWQCRTKIRRWPTT